MKNHLIHLCIFFCLTPSTTAFAQQKIAYDGNSAFIDFKGDVLLEHQGSEQVLQHPLSKTALEAFRAKFPAWQDADQYQIIE